MNQIVQHIAMKENTEHIMRLRAEIAELRIGSYIFRKIIKIAYVIAGVQILILAELLWLIAKH